MRTRLRRDRARTGRPRVCLRWVLTRYCRPRHGYGRSSPGAGERAESAELAAAARARMCARPGVLARGPLRRAPVLSHGPAPGPARCPSPARPSPVRTGQRCRRARIAECPSRCPHDHPDRAWTRSHGEPDHVAGASVLDRVLQQRVHGQAEALAVGADRDRVQPAELPVPLRRGPPASQHLHDEAIKGDGLGPQKSEFSDVAISSSFSASTRACSARRPRR